jgi:tRNA nucleotidyltransferase (CCA-adding enzyme)
MPKVINLASRIKRRLPAELIEFMRVAGELAQRQDQKLYLVGGVIRDLLLERDNVDLDLVSEGDAINLAQELARMKQGEVTTHPRFGTAKLRWDKWSVDLATARAETYARPGALPAVKPSSINDDLSRRDFTINAMAVHLNPGHFGELLDPHGGRDDIERRLIRVLHEKSFVDDATRIWRALRYEQRLDFILEPATLALLKHDVAMLATISGDRIRHELELILKEPFPEKALHRADELGILSKLHPSLKCDSWLVETLALAREQSPNPPQALCLALLFYRLTADETEHLISYLRLARTTAHILRDTGALKAKIGSLAVPGLAPSRIYSLLHGYGSLALTANIIATDSATIAEHIELYLTVLRYVKPAVTGKDLKKLGVPPGPKIKEILSLLFQAKLDGKASSRKEEEEIVRGLIKSD